MQQIQTVNVSSEQNGAKSLELKTRVSAQIQPGSDRISHPLICIY